MRIDEEVPLCHEPITDGPDVEEGELCCACETEIYKAQEVQDVQKPPIS